MDIAVIPWTQEMFSEEKDGHFSISTLIQDQPGL